MVTHIYQHKALRKAYSGLTASVHQIKYFSFMLFKFILESHNGRVLNEKLYTRRIRKLYFFLFLFSKLFRKDYSSLVRRNFLIIVTYYSFKRTIYGIGQRMDYDDVV